MDALFSWEEPEERVSNKKPYPIDRYLQLSNFLTHIAINRPRIKYGTVLVLSIVSPLTYTQYAVKTRIRREIIVVIDIVINIINYNKIDRLLLIAYNVYHNIHYCLRVI